MGTFLNLSVPHLHVKKGGDNCTFLIELLKNLITLFIKHLEQSWYIESIIEIPVIIDIILGRTG